MFIALPGPRSLCAAAFALLACLGPATAAEAPLWFDSGRPGPQARQAVELLANASSHGLDPQDYDAVALSQAVARAAQGTATDLAAIAQLEQALSDAMQRYLSDLHRGRVDLRQIGLDYSEPRRDPFDAASVLKDALATQRLSDAARDAAPRLPQYEQLREVLARYRNLAAHPAWRQALPPLPRGDRGRPAKLEPGQDYAGLEQLAQRLEALGDLAPQASAAPRYEGPLVDAVKTFQQRHGLAADGVIGKATLVQLEVSPSARVRQIELMLERLRWTPLTQGRRMIVVNIPEFVLRAYEVVDSRISVQLEMKVIVGKAMDTRTPVFDEDMRYIEFSPYWNVPPSIARAEIAPHLRRDPGYFDRMGFEFVAADGQVSASYSPAALDDVLAGRSRIRQRAGPQNALGDIKFVFPNREHIYLHHTPSTRLFERDRRDLSHGCIRVEQPVALAKFVLQDMPQWTEERIRLAMAKGQSSTLRLAEPIPVLIAYGTTLVVGGRVHFFQDLYGQDRRLDNALQRRAPIRRTMNKMKLHDTSAGARRHFLRHTVRIAMTGAIPALATRARASLPDARRLALSHTHTGERIDLVYAVGASFVPEAMGSLNRFLRDHYSGNVGLIDPQLFDLLHIVQRTLSSERAFEVISGYRCPATNASLRETRGGGVAKHSLHMEGRAIDIRLPGVPLADLRDAALSLRSGGVGFYPREQFVHLDTGRVRNW